MKGTTSQCNQILAFLSEGKPLTPLLALEKFGCFRLAARIKNLKDEGHTIVSTMIVVTNRLGEESKVAEYRMAGAGGDL